MEACPCMNFLSMIETRLIPRTNEDAFFRLEEGVEKEKAV